MLNIFPMHVPSIISYIWFDYIICYTCLVIYGNQIETRLWSNMICKDFEPNILRMWITKQNSKYQPNTNTFLDKNEFKL